MTGTVILITDVPRINSYAKLHEFLAIFTWQVVF